MHAKWSEVTLRAFVNVRLRDLEASGLSPSRRERYIANMRIRSFYTFLLLWLFTCGLARASELALVGAKIYPSPTEQAIENGSILVHDGRIVALGPSAAVKVPQDATVIDCKGLVVTAGFWNSHVHILLPGLLHAEKLSSQQIT